VIADFLIGAHALEQADRLLTRDRGFHRRAFDGLVIVDPSADPGRRHPTARERLRSVDRPQRSHRRRQAPGSAGLPEASRRAPPTRIATPIAGRDALDLRLLATSPITKTTRPMLSTQKTSRWITSGGRVESAAKPTTRPKRRFVMTPTNVAWSLAMRMFGETFEVSPPEVTNCVTRYMKMASATTTHRADAPANAAASPRSQPTRRARGITRTRNNTTATRLSSR
jgi:hypothetical protein